MRLKVLLLICPFAAAVNIAMAKPVKDSVGVENVSGKKVVLHKVEPKETYFAVGRRYNVKPNLIIQYNNNIVLQPGATIKIPTELPFAEPVKAAPAQMASAKPEVKQTIQQFRVSAGETLYSIARRFNTTVDEIKALNSLTSDVLSPGQTLNIKSSGTSATTEHTANVARPAATENSNTTLAQALQSAKSQIQGGQTTQTQQQVQSPVKQEQTQVTVPAPQIQTPAPQNNAPVSTANTQQYKVSNGETLYTIAKRFNTSVEDIIALNKIENNTITPGQLLTVRSGMPPAAKPAQQQTQAVVAKRDSTNPTLVDSLGDKHINTTRYGLFEKNEKGAATWMEDADIDPKKQLVLHRTAPIGTVLRITNPMTNRTVFAKVVGRFADNESNKDAILVVTKGVAESLGAMDKRFRVNVSYGVPANEQQQ
ncbi:LysM peptidoglycan-binding domain-containing protein [Mucilaginibacter myungsuensis]|uniref:LysM peptidoglycan-binding domain-containing protein n=1 Tax=Mucilaginibacter myungsuensis TaxID=649104 RepID=A0A929PUG6_9SPHI|nr:LysM peptidoglycan-binding domain-containing protein [Mucilaginibacter myungsuensis]MBE9660738.1 LysM peptidoglycan-binding domain-containing protein [Mucilaginibacter myungsuensis]MDN3600783.1 LysM peptidoglycan-binding domain-containing protein [Mucilaginibacter myungsuensis]